ncbi:MAG: superfamily II DNA/RNA helicase [Sphingobacteriales bacterium]|jgi:superfamily II DNA/RNA helicase
MLRQQKSLEEILAKLDISALNEMQVKAMEVITSNNHVMLLSPTGTGKTVAFLLPLLQKLNPSLNEVQLLILVPSRELAIQIEQVVREMGSGYKANAVYGGRQVSKDKLELKQAPAILIGTPGRVADHIRRKTVSTKHIANLVLDEFDKSLEVGFEKDMIEIVDDLSALTTKVLTSATQNVDVPNFITFDDPIKLDFLTNQRSQLSVKIVPAQDKDKLEALVTLLKHIGDASGIVFCNFRESIQFVSDYLNDNDIDHSCFYGTMEQRDRERSLIKFRNGSSKVLLATDLAARGIDVPEMDYIIHYQLPIKEEEFIHRNGRTARMNKSGTSYVLKWVDQSLPPFIKGDVLDDLKPGAELSSSKLTTLFISGGRKDKISKGDIAGMFFKQGGLKSDELGNIELKQDCAFVSVPEEKVDMLVEKLNNQRLKKKKVRITIIEN